MSSASSPTRRTAPAAAGTNTSAGTHSTVAVPAAASRAAPAHLDAAQIPPLDTNLDIDGLRPTLLSRLLGLLVPKR